MHARLAGVLVDVAGLFVPAGRRGEWLEEWRGELAALCHARAAGVSGLPTVVGFAAGALAHAMWMRTEGWTMDGILQDVRYGARRFRKELGFTSVAVTTLALGIGANAAIYSVASEALFQAPPVKDPESVVAVYTTSRRGFPRSSSSYPDYVDYRDRSTGLLGLAATSLRTVSLGDDSRGARLATVQSVTGNFFELLGLTPGVGRLIRPDDDLYGGGLPVTVLSNRLWHDHFAADPSVVGSTIRLNGVAYDVVGVAQPDFDGLRINISSELWIPMQSLPYLEGGTEPTESYFGTRSSRWMDLLVGRLADGVSADAARADLITLSDLMREEEPGARGPRSVTLDELSGYILPSGSEATFRTFVFLLGGTVGLALLLCIANLVNLLLARATTQAREVGVRLAIGAGRGRVVRQLLTESLLLAAVGGLAGLGVAVGMIELLGRFELPGGVPIESLGVTLDGRVLVVTGVLALGTGILFGLAPALVATRANLVNALKSGGGGRGATGGTRTRKALVAVQVALCLVLLVGSGLFIQTIRRGLSTELGFEAEGLALTRFNLSLIGYEEAEALALVEAVEDRVRRMATVTAAFTSTRVPLQNGGARGRFFGVEGYEAAADEELRVDVVFTTPGFVETLRQPLLAGRSFLSSDQAGAEDVTVINRAMAERYWPVGQAVGGVVYMGDMPVRVVGVAENSTWNGLADDLTNYMYLPLQQTGSIAVSSFLTLGVRTSGDPDAILGSVREILRSLEPELSLSYQRSMETMVADVLMPQRMGAVVLSAFGLLALILSAVGIAGVVAYSVSRQTHDIGVRVALGATRASVLVGVSRSMVAPVLFGLVAGVFTARGLSRLVEGFMFGVTATDPLIYCLISMSVLGIAAVATIVPARRAGRVNPIDVLRAE